MIKLQRAELKPEEFKEIFCEGFGEYNGEMPQTVFLAFDSDKRVAFCSVYVHNRGNLYLQYLAFAKDIEIEKKYGYYVEVLEALHKFGYPFIMGAINSKNKKALIFALRSGFQINGVRQDTKKELFVEILHQQEVI